MQRIDISVASALGPDELRHQIAEIVEEIIVDLKIQLNATELKSIVRLLVDDMIGLGPLEPLLHDESVTDIMVNGPFKVYVERKGKVELTDVVFRDDPHVLHVATRIVTEVGRRVDEFDAAGRRPPQGRQPRQHHHPAAGHRRPDHLDPQVLQEGDHPRRHGAAEQHLARHGDGAEDRRPRAPQHPDLRRHRLGQDHAPERHEPDDRPRRAHDHHRGRRRAAAAAAARRPPGDPPLQHRGRGRDHHAPPRQERAAHAPRPDHPRRVSAARRRSTCCRR